MPINTNGSSIRVETNIQGTIVDNDEWVATKAYLEHHNNDVNAEELNNKALEDLYNPKSKTVNDLRIRKANKDDLKLRSITPTEP